MRLISWIALLLMASVLWSCDHDKTIGCTAGSCLYIMIQDQNGDNLLDITKENNLVDKFSGYVTCDGKTYELDWSIAYDEMVGVFPLEEDISLYEENQEEIFKWEQRYRDPGNISPVSTGFRYHFFAMKRDVSYYRFPSDSFIYFGDLDLHKDAKKKIKLSFPELGIEYDIVWKVKFNGTDTVIVNGEKQEGNTVYITLPTAAK